MRIRLTKSFAALAVSIAVAAPAAGQFASDPDMKEIAAYRLTMEAVNKVAAATRTMVAEIKKDPRFQEVTKIDAEIKALEAKPDRTETDQKRLDELKARKDSLTSAVVGISMEDAQTLAAFEAKIRKSPPLMAALKGAGMAPREYATCLLSMLQSGIAAGMKKAGMLKDLPPGVSPENVKFVEEHEAELRALQKEFEALAPGR